MESISLLSVCEVGHEEDNNLRCERKNVEKEIDYIPVRYVVAVFITLLEVLAVIGIVIALCYYVPYFYLAAWATEILVVIRIIASDDNPDYKVPWLLFVLIIPIAGFIFTMTRSFYQRLMKAGVKIYEYEPGFIHAKSYLADDTCAMIGTINLDYRSLVHHFENGVWMYKCDAVNLLKRDMEDTLAKSIEVTPDMLKTNLLQRFVCALVRIFAPML